MNAETERVRIAEALGVARQFFLVKRGLYWRPNAKGYTSCMAEAWRLSEEEANRYVHPHDTPVTKQSAPLPDYHTDPSAALSICEFMRGKGWASQIELTFEGEWSCDFLRAREAIHSTYKKTLPDAICTAFLVWVEGGGK